MARRKSVRRTSAASRKGTKKSPGTKKSARSSARPARGKSRSTSLAKKRTRTTARSASGKIRPATKALAGATAVTPVQLWIDSDDDRNINTQGSVSYDLGSVIQDDVRLAQGGDASPIPLGAGLYRYDFRNFNGKGKFTLGARDGVTKSSVSPSEDFQTMNQRQTYRFQVEE